MPCYHPLRAWRSERVNANGKRELVFRKEQAFNVLDSIDLPCGKCIGCRLERSRQWAIRCMHEASLYDDNCFLTLTYDNEHLPEDGSLNKKHFQDFMKRFRKKFPDSKIRYFHCGEYGEQLGRPHYHACIFNFDFEDKKLYKIVNDQRLYTSVVLNELWSFGFCIIGSVTFESAAYVARYITKKVTGEKAEEHYKGKCPEYITMSRRPGIGKGWYDKYHSDTCGNDFIILRGKKVGVPKFYDDQLSESELKEVKSKRRYESYKHSENKTLSRLQVRETIKNSKVKLLKRSFESD
jgi:hypothetical protein